MLTRHTAWGDSEAGRQCKGSSWRPASESPQAVRSGPRDITAQPEQFERPLAPCRGTSAGGCEEHLARDRELEGDLGRREFRVQPKLILASRLVRESALDSASSSSIRPSRTRL